MKKYLTNNSFPLLNNQFLIMDDYYDLLDLVSEEISKKYEIKNLKNVDNPYDENGYWKRLCRLSFFNKLDEENRYHFLHEIQSLSNQIHFGIINCILLKDKLSTDIIEPSRYNHRYTFMIESTIHCIYSYWNRVGLALNTYLKNPKNIRHTYFANVIKQLVIDYPTLRENYPYQWIYMVKVALEKLDRNEFAHNNSLIMQNFLPQSSEDVPFKKLLGMTDILLSHNKLIVDDIFNLVSLLENLESIVKINRQPSC